MSEISSASDPASAARWRFPALSFRLKFILVVGAAVLFDLLLSGGIALWNVNRLSNDATRQIESGLTKASEEYLRNYIETTALRSEAVLAQAFAEVGALAESMQSLIDQPVAQKAIGDALAPIPGFSPALDFNAEAGWAQNAPGSGPSVLSIWRYLLDDQGRTRPEVEPYQRFSSAFDVVSVGSMARGAEKLQVYYVGPKHAPVMRTTPYSDQAQTFDKLYPGHNDANWWDFFFPGVYESWRRWISDPASRPVHSSSITTTAPYVDAITGKLIVSYFHPLWTEDRKDVAGMVAADVTLQQLAAIVEHVTLAETGFGFLTMSNGNVLAINPQGEKALGLSIASGAAQSGVSGMERTLGSSSFPEIAALSLPADDDTHMLRVTLGEADAAVPYIVVLRRLRPANLWNGKDDIVKEHLTLGFVVPSNEIYASLLAAQEDIQGATQRIMRWQAFTLVLSMLVVLLVVVSISKRITGGLSALAEGARRLQNKDYSVRVSIPSRDEVGQVGVAFNAMAAEIQYHTDHLEQLVADRTKALGEANREILALNEQLKSENLRMGAELDVARRVQMMVLPKPGELLSIPHLEIASYLRPADEVGGDYYDVLSAGSRVKVGIGDVTGHGLESGVLMLMVQSVARALQEQGSDDPRTFLSVLNRAIYKNVERTESGNSLTLAFVDYADETITISGQHEELQIIRKSGVVERIDTTHLGFPIGLEPDIEAWVDTHQLPFNSGDIMLLHTDGVTEASNAEGELFGMQRLAASAFTHRHGSAEDIVRNVIADLMLYVGDSKIHDDITLVVLRHR